MKIECKIKREGGSVIDIDGTEYHFKPEVKDGPHYCTVANKKHAQRFLAIPEGYCLPGGADDPEDDDLTDDEAGSIGPENDGQSGSEDLERDSEPEDDDQEPTDEEGNQGEPETNDDFESLKEEYTEKFGRKPHYKWTAERIKQEIASLAE